ncbi:MAG: hypothetical protein CBE24_03470 [bacterium TMED264]|nr:MAG: hypothetical protein CBE24_03470 [bacterium TMED264]|tara:strand:- start:331 stop:1422 length:1092 start_codon:yes stop_codon:yes gene_type:complete
MIKTLLIFLFFISSIFPQSEEIELPPDKGVEYKLNDLSGAIFDEVSKEPLEDVNVDLFTGNKVLKHSILTNESGNFSKKNIGYLWKPRIKLTLENYKTKIIPLLPDLLDSLGNIYVEHSIQPLPENERVATLERSTLTKRAEIFFIKGNLFYYLVNKRSAKKIIIKDVKALEIRPQYISMNVNGKTYDISKCYVPQYGRFENLSFILKTLLSEPVFKNSGLPVYIPQHLLEPTVIFGTIFDKNNGAPIPGAEIILSEAWNKPTSFTGNDSLSITKVMPMAEYFSNLDKKNKKEKKFYNFQYNTFKRRVSDEDGRYAFTVNRAGIYQLDINPPGQYADAVRGKPNILVKYGRGGWYKSNFSLSP